MLNRFCPLGKKKQPLFLTDNTNLYRIRAKIKWKIHTCLHFTSYSEGTSYKKNEIQLLVLLFLVSSMSAFTSRYHFSQISRTSSNLIWKKLIVTNFCLLTDSLRYPLPLQPRSSKHDERFCWCSLIRSRWVGFENNV